LRELGIREYSLRSSKMIVVTFYILSRKNGKRDLFTFKAKNTLNFDKVFI
jgi:hypothetical protein